MNKSLIIWGAITAALAVMLGAFGAHALKSILTTESLQSFQTAVNYQLIHGISTLVVGMMYERAQEKLLLLAGRLFLAGILCFSGSIYLLTFLKHQHISFPPLIALVTPVGGILMIFAWLCTAWTFLRK